jgi:probable addiction module antidote protein
MPKRTKNYHSWLLNRLTNPRAAANYLNAAMNDSAEMFLTALRNVAEARTMAKVAQEAGVNRESLYRSLSEEGNPRLSTLNSVLNALGLKIAVEEQEHATATLTPGNMQIEDNPTAPFNFTTGNIVESASAWTGNRTAIISINTSTTQADIRASDIPFFLVIDAKKHETVSQFS